VEVTTMLKIGSFLQLHTPLAWDFNDNKCKNGSGGINSYYDATQAICIFNYQIKHYLCLYTCKYKLLEHNFKCYFIFLKKIGYQN
jgi:hypothetical protein